MNMEQLILSLPKAELHLHIEGTFEPELMFIIAKRNNIKLKYKSVEELKKAYKFNNLQDFLDIYYEGCNALLHEQDFYDLTYAYFTKAYEQNIVHAEIMFAPQTHTNRGVSFETVIAGIYRAQADANKNYNISSKLIISFLRHLDEEAAFEVFEQAKPFRGLIDAIGLDSSELNHPPAKFKHIFREARKNGFFITAHAGEEGPPEYIWEAINILKADRIDHGNRCLENEELVKYLADNQIPLTICPLSNLKLKVVDDLKKHPLKEMLDKGLFININSDDPAYFGGYLNKNYIELQKHLNLTESEIIILAKNSIKASMLTEDEKNFHLSNF